MIPKYFLPFLAFFFSYYPETFETEARVVKIIDGDTIEMIRTGNTQKEKLRLVYIDAPELSQKPWGQNAKDYLSQKILGSEVTVIIHGKDHYGRSLGEVIDRGESVNFSLVKKGLTYIYPWSKFETVEKKYHFLLAQQKLQRQKIGIWGDKKLLSPWKYRRVHKALTPLVISSPKGERSTKPRL